MCEHLGIKDAKSSIRLARCHRLESPAASNRQMRGSTGKTSNPRPIIVCFQSFLEREQVWKKRSNLKGTGFFLKEDIPESVEQERRSLYPIFKKLKKRDIKPRSSATDWSLVESHTQRTLGIPCHPAFRPETYRKCKKVIFITSLEDYRLLAISAHSLLMESNITVLTVLPSAAC